MGTVFLILGVFIVPLVVYVLVAANSPDGPSDDEDPGFYLGG